MLLAEFIFRELFSSDAIKVYHSVMHKAACKDEEVPYDMHITYVLHFIKDEAYGVKNSAKHEKIHTARSDSLIIRV